VIIVDSSVWVDHFRQSDQHLVVLLDSAQVLMHRFILGELSLGSMQRRDMILRLLADLPQAVVASDDEVMGLITREALFGLGIGYVDCHLLASARLTPNTKLWTRDKRLHAAASQFGVAAI
jgi:predicted nucleic acid-binding protein